ncbi:uncharacterized protein SSO2610 [Nanoarchaeota archaeon]
MIDKELLDKPAQKPFEFLSSYYIPKYTNIKAYDVNQLIEGIKKVDKLSIFYHVFHQLFINYTVPGELHNDFALWVKEELHDIELSKKLSKLDGREPKNIENIRNDIIKILEENKIDEKASKPFIFISCTPFIFKNDKIAKDLGELIDNISVISINSIIYHFIFRRLMGETTKNDFSLWIEENYGLRTLSDSLSSIDPIIYDDGEKLRQEIIKRIEELIFS